VGAEQGATVCAESPQPVSLEVRPRGSIGRAALILARSNVGASRQLATRPEIVGVEPLLPINEALATHRRRTARLALASPVGEGSATVGRVASVPVSLPSGCSRIDVVGGAPLGRFRSELWSAAGVLLDASEGGANAPLFRCSSSIEPVRIEVTALGQPGPFVVELRSGPVPDRTLVDATRAASRLLQELDTPLAPVEASAAVGAGRVSLEPERALERPLAFPAGCSKLVVAVDSAVALTGELMLATEVQGRLLYGQGVLASEVCSSKPLSGRLRLRAASATIGLLHVAARRQ
jgi:hypothetical protein